MITVGSTSLICPRCGDIILIDITTPSAFLRLIGSPTATFPLRPDFANLYAHLETCPTPPSPGLSVSSF